MEQLYKITSAYDRNNNKKNIYSWGESTYFIRHISIGSSAYLIQMDSDKALITSRVEDLSIYENTIKITTANSIYYLEPIIEGIV